MGEYIKNNKTKKYDKLGTCENLYYTTYDKLKDTNLYLDAQKADFLKADSGYRFRFPFPDEVNKNLLEETDFNRGVLFVLPKWANVEIGHGSVFHRTDKTVDGVNLDYGIRVPCIESEQNKSEYFKWNMDYKKPIEIVQQKLSSQLDNGVELITIARCPYCGAMSALSKDEIIEMMKYTDNSMFKTKILEIALKGYK